MIQMTQTQIIEFDSIDDVVEMIESRFEIARIDFVESMRESLIDELHNYNSLTFEFDVLHDVIEQNLRNACAMHYAREYAKHNDEFANVVAIVDEITFHQFAIVDLNVETKIARIIAYIVVDDNLCIEIIAQ